MASQQKCEECKSYYSWFRGHNAYKDEFQPEINTILALQREPENAKDPHAVAITEHEEQVVGHIPLGLSKIVSPFLKRVNHRGEAVICRKRVNRGAGMGLEISVLYKLYGGHQYLTRLDELMGSDVARQSLRAKQEGISRTAEATRKRKSGKNIEAAKK